MTRGRLLAVLICFCALAFADERIVTIESARTSEYVKTGESDAPGEEAGSVIRFGGLVVISVTEGSSVSRISADEIIYDKKRDTLEANGNVTYEHTTGKSGSEKFTGKALLFNIKKQEGVFLEGIVTQDTGKTTSDPFVIHAESTGRDSSSTMAFKHAALTTCDAEDPHWSIKASRIWLLPGNEIAIFNGLFFIGPLPVFYIPLFYYPSDEMIVHPVFGSRNREGYFVQTTTYFAGRKPLPVKTGTDNSFGDFLGSDTLKEQKRNGLFLRNLETDAKTTDPDYLKLMADAYSGLGGMVGVDGSFTRDGYIKSVAFSGALGFSHTLYAPDSSGGIYYSTYDAAGEQNYNYGWLFGNKVPFRYRSTFSMQMDKKPFNLSLSIPLISDPLFKSDFLNRSEDLNWFKFLTEQDTLSKLTTVSEESSYSWDIKGSVTPDVTGLNPWIKSFSISKVSGGLTFNSKTNSSLNAADLIYAPDRKFFYPELIKPELALSLSGTLYSSVKTANAVNNEKPDTSDLSNPFASNSGESEKSGESKKAPAADQTDTDRFLPSGGTDLVPAVVPITDTYTIDYSIDPAFLQEIRYNSADWASPKDINWNSYESVYYQVKNTVSLTGTYNHDVNFFTVSTKLTFTNTYQDHPVLTGIKYDTEAEKNVLKLYDYKANVYLLTTTDSVKMVPFNRDPFFKPVSVSWNFTGDLIRNAFNGTVDHPSWKTDPFQFDRDYIDTHTATGVFGVALANYEQKLTVVSNLPPLLQSYTGNADFACPISTLNMNTKLFEKENDYKQWFWDPFKATLSWKLPYGITLGQEYTYDIEERTPSRLNFTGGYGFFSAFYTLNNTVPYTFNGSNWVIGTDKHFIPSATGFTFNNSSKPLRLYSWKNRIFLQTNLMTDLQFNLLKLNESSFDFVPSITLKVYEFFDLTFSSNSRNDVIARYFQDWLDLPSPLPGERNMFVDIYKSVNFSNRRDREESGFKLKSLSVSVIHYLHDWTMNLTTTVKPELKESGGSYHYDFVPTVVFMVQWKPISDIKTTVKSEEGVFSLNTKDDTTN